jgi:Fe-S cluster biosynthesis and repair protein YggX
MGAEEWAAEQRALINEKYKNDPKERKRKHMVIDDLLRKHI